MIGDNLFMLGFRDDVCDELFALPLSTSTNQSPADLSLSSNSVLESAAVGTAIGNLTTTDPDAGDSFTYSLVDGAGDFDNAAFRIVDNQLVTQTHLDFETKPSFRVLIRTTDAGGLSLDKVFIIQVTDVVLAGDINGDDQVDLADFAMLRRNFGRSNATLAMGDVNGDGKVDLEDLSLLRANFNRKV